MNSTILIWLLLLLGWFSYWLNQLNNYRTDAAGKPYVGYFLADNFIEMILSLIGCVLYVIFKLTLVPIDFKTGSADFTLGYTSCDFINGFITKVKPQALIPTDPAQTDTVDKKKV